MNRKAQFLKILLGLLWALTACAWSPAQRLSAGTNHSLFICADSTVMAWGLNSSLQLGNGTAIDCKTPTEVIGLDGVIAVAAGDRHSLALKSDGTVWAWGANDLGQLGIGGTGSPTGIVQVSLNGTVVAIATRLDHSLALLSDSTVWAWGANGSGQIGIGNTSPSVSNPVMVLDSVIAIGTGELHSLAVLWDSTVMAWGENSQGQLGNGSNTSISLPVQTSILSGVKAVAGGGYHSMALKANGEVWAWGDDSFEQLGNGVSGPSNVPVPAIALPPVRQLDAGQRHSTAVDVSGNLWVWGESSQGRLGLGNVPNNQNTPVQVPSISGIKEVRGGSIQSLAFASGNTVWCFGNNDYGQLGEGSTIDRYFPSHVIGLCPPIEADSALDYNAAFGPSSGGMYKWIAGELQSSILLPGGKTMWLFGRSKINTIAPDGSIVCGQEEIDNCILIQDDAFFNTPVTQIDTTLGQTNRSYFKLSATDSTVLKPGHGYVHGDSAYIFLSRWDSAGSFLGNYFGRLGITTMDLEDINRMLPGTYIDFGKAVIVDSVAGYVYAYGSRIGSSALRLPYVARQPFGFPDAPWEYFDSLGWTSDTLLARPVSDYEVDENFSVHKLQGKYYLVTQDAVPGSASCGVQRNILVYRSNSLTGRFANPGWIYTDHTIYGAQPLLAFGAYAHPKPEHCDTLLVSYDVRDQAGTVGLDSCQAQCQVSGSQLADAWRPKFIRVPYPMIDSTLSQVTQASFIASQVGNTWYFTNTSTLAYQFVWDFGDGSPQQTGTHVSHEFTSGGSFTVTLIAAGCGTPDTVDNSVTKVDDPLSDAQIWLFPNPSSGRIYLRAQALKQGPVTIEILNAMGQVLVQSTERPVQGNLSTSMDLNLDKGFYLVRLGHGGRSTVVRLCLQ